MTGVPYCGILAQTILTRSAFGHIALRNMEITMKTNPELYLQDLIDSNEDELVIKDGGGDAFHDAFIKACRENGCLRQLDKRSIRVQSLYISNYSKDQDWCDEFTVLCDCLSSWPWLRFVGGCFYCVHNRCLVNAGSPCI